jgi:1-acyl-sn-glycerol-3-phosphate acyltransferase
VILRRFRRAVALGFALALCIVRGWRRPVTLERRALWLQACSRSVLRSLGVAVRVQGTPPARGLVVSNHLSYLDILVISAAVPCFFVSKLEVARWPYFGWAARTAGTIFLDRASRSSAAAVAGEMSVRLALSVPVLLFPEGTSTDGAQVLRFHPRLMEPATRSGAPITPVAIRYVLAGGVQERELCWFGDVGFVSHLWKVLGVAGFSAQLQFGAPNVYADPRVAAEQTHTEVSAMRNAQLPIAH